ncbi:hypothetical protein WT60_21845 [Burkholderia sp. MSMB617WGS]|nr:hypothetical protein WT60_21845 [Burkholderia sp. MSMB617WGS]
MARSRGGRAGRALTFAGDSRRAGGSSRGVGLRFFGRVRVEFRNVASRPAADGGPAGWRRL